MIEFYDTNEFNKPNLITWSSYGKITIFNITNTQQKQDAEPHRILQPQQRSWKTPLSIKQSQ